MIACQVEVVRHVSSEKWGNRVQSAKKLRIAIKRNKEITRGKRTYLRDSLMTPLT